VIFNPIEGIDGAWTIDHQPHDDDRGRFSRTFDLDEWGSRGLSTSVDHIATSNAPAAATLRGMHLQSWPHQEAKSIWCTRGQVFDVVVDARVGTAGFGTWAAVVLSEDVGRTIHLPAGVAHGFLTLAPGSEITYVISSPYVASAAGGFRWDDPDLAIGWPVTPQVIGERDRRLPTMHEWASAQEERSQ